MIHYVSGGQRSGKSAYAMSLAKKLSPNPVYLATSRIWDDQHHARIRRHQDDRDTTWKTIEEEIHLYRHDLRHETVVMDCVTLWLTNIYTDCAYDTTRTLEEACAVFDRFADQDFNLIVISNEIGMGLHADTPAGRDFTDLQGWMNQHIAAKANHATFMVSGIPLQLK